MKPIICYRAVTCLWIVTILFFYFIFNTFSIVESHANLVQSQPKQNSVLEYSPTDITITFSEPLSPTLSYIEVYNFDGSKLDNNDSSLNSLDKSTLTISVPVLPKGTYTVFWQTVSTIDGHKIRGSFYFSIGEPIQFSNIENYEPLFLYESEPIIKSFSLLGTLILFGSFFTYIFIITPVLAGKTAINILASKACFAVLLISYAMATLSSITQLILHTSSIYEIGLFNTIGSPLINIYTDTTWGKLMWLKLLILLFIPVVFQVAKLISNHHSKSLYYINPVFFIPISLMLLLLHSLSSHNATVSELYYQGVFIDFIHMLFSAIWIGGVLLLTITLYAVKNTANSIDLNNLTKSLFKQFSPIAILTIIILSITGIFSAWLQVNKIEALSTYYGVTLVVKVCLIAIALLIAGINSLFFIKTRKISSVPGRLLISESILIIAIIFSVGVLNGLEPAKNATPFFSNQLTLTEMDNNLQLELQILPADVGINNTQIHLSNSRGENIVNASNIVIQTTYINQDLGSHTYYAQNMGNGSYTTDPLMLNLGGIWQFEITVQRPDALDSRFAFREAIGGSHPEFTFLDIYIGKLLFGFVILSIGLTFLGISVKQGGWQDDSGKKYFILGLASIIAGFSISIYTHSMSNDRDFQYINPMVPSSVSIQIGQNLYRGNCVSCHGVTGIGNGYLYNALTPKPNANNLLIHVPLHSDNELFSIIKYGKDGTSMYGQEGILFDEEIWHVINYIKTLE